MSEERKVIESENQPEILTAFKSIPYVILNEEIQGSSQSLVSELAKIESFYKIYKKGAKFLTEGTNNDYTPAMLRSKLCASLINKEARFLFAESPSISIDAKGDLSSVTKEAKQSLTVWNDVVKTILDSNKFEDSLLKAAKDCFIGKRVAGMVNFNEETGVTVSFLPSTQFIYETLPGDSNVITKFVGFMNLNGYIANKDRRIFKKRYEKIDDKIWLEESIYDGMGNLLEVITEMQEIELNIIPVCIFINDGLTNEINGESEVEIITESEKWYSKLSNADIDAERKSMNPTKYTVDMDSNSTKNLSTAAGSLWDLGSDQNLSESHPQVGMLEPAMNYSNALKTTLDRIKTSAYELIDMPNVTLETMQGAITSGKSLKAIYWPLIVRCKEKMKMWGPQLRQLIDIIIKGSLVYPNCVKKYTNDTLMPVAYEIIIEQNNPLPEDEIEEKNMDLSEVESKTMSRKAYMKKWRELTDDEVDEELRQIAYERQIIEDSAFEVKNEFNSENLELEDEEIVEDEDDIVQ